MLIYSAWHKRWACFMWFSPHLVSLYRLLSVPKEETEESSARCWEGRGGPSVRTPCSLCLLGHTAPFPRVLGCGAPEAAREVVVGASVPLGVAVVYSVLPGALAHGVDGAPLFFVHPCQRHCCSGRSGRTGARPAAWGGVAACVSTQLSETGVFSWPPDTGGARGPELFEGWRPSDLPPVLPGVQFGAFRT